MAPLTFRHVAKRILTAVNGLEAHKRYTAVIHPDYQVQVSDETEAPAWDAFVARSPGGHHVQTNLWARVKSTLGWRTKRITITRDEKIIAGAQILFRPLPFVGAVGHVSRGPLVTGDDPLAADLIINKLKEVARRNRIQLLSVQPPAQGEMMAGRLRHFGFLPSVINIGQPTATVLIDLTADFDTILAGMKKATRKHIRRGMRAGITVREGLDSDLDTFYDLLVATSQRQNFSTYPKAYFYEMWRGFRPAGYVRLFVAEYRDEPVSAHWVIPFGDTLISKLAGWSGNHGKLRPNEVLEWEVIRWAKHQNLRYYDLEGIDPEAARLLVQGQPLPDRFQNTPTSYKLRFGGRVALFPGAYDYLYNPLFRWGYKLVLARIIRSSLVKHVLNRLRTR